MPLTPASLLRAMNPNHARRFLVAFAAVAALAVAALTIALLHPWLYAAYGEDGRRRVTEALVLTGAALVSLGASAVRHGFRGRKKGGGR